MTFILTEALERNAKQILPAPLPSAVSTALEHLREGCFQRSLCLIVSATSVASGLEVGYEHYKGSYSNPVMYTPVALSGTLAGAGLLGVFSARAARSLLRWVSVITLADGIIGFFFHVRGVARKPGGWSLPVTNIVMGPPIFAPLLFGTSAYLGLMASYLRREEELPIRCPEFMVLSRRCPSKKQLALKPPIRKIPEAPLGAYGTVGFLQRV